MSTQLDVNAVARVIQKILMQVAHYPDEVRIIVCDREHETELIVSAHRSDTGRLIGPNGKTVQAVRTLMVIFAQRVNRKLLLRILDK